MNQLLGGMELTVDRIDGHRLGMFEEASTFKAALITSPDLKQVMEKRLGWPVFAVVPCRDFLYLVPARDRALLNGIGEVVVREYRKSGYPISTEVLEISDKGIRAIGAFPVESQ